MRAIVEGALATDRLDVIVYSIWEREASLIHGGEPADESRPFVECITNLAGLQELVKAGRVLILLNTARTA